jgi:hypothetical protein
MSDCGARVASTGAWSEGPFQLARRLVDDAGAAGRRKRRRQQDMVDAQAAVEPEAHLPVVPPRVELGRLLEQAEGIDQAEFDKLAEGRALRFAAQDLVLPRRRVMHVAVLRRDVVIAEQGQLREALQFAAQMVFQGRQPAQLVFIFVAADLLPVGHVGADHAHSVDGRRQHALLFVGEIGDVETDLLQRAAGEYRDTVVGLLPVVRGAVAGGFQLGVRKRLVLHLGFLQAEHVRLRRRQPVEHVRQAHLERIDVPCRDLHASMIPERGDCL